MQTTASNLSLMEEMPRELLLNSPNRRWLSLFGMLISGFPWILIGILLLPEEGETLNGIIAILFGSLFTFAYLLLAPFYSVLSVKADSRSLILTRDYWLGLGTLGRKREKSWKFEDVTNTYISSRGLSKIIDIEINGKKDFVLGFSPRKKEDAQRFYDVFQSWRKGLTPDTGKAVEALDEIASKTTIVNSLKSVEKMLYFFGVISLISGGMDLMTAWAVEQNQFAMNFDFRSSGILSFSVGLVYLACGYGAKKRSEISLWIAMLVVIAERLYEFLMTKSLGGEWGFSSIFVWAFAFFIVSSLWKAIQSIRSMEDNSTFEPLA